MSAVRGVACVALLAMAVAGCGYTETHDVVLRPVSGISPHAVEVYVGAQVPLRPFYEVALVQAVGHGGDANMESVTRALGARASALGCDAVVRVRVDQGYSMANGVGVCVRWSTVAPPPAGALREVPAPSPAPAPAPPPAPAPAEGTSL